MLTVKQAAQRAGVSSGLIYLWIAGGELPHFRLGAKGRRGKISIAETDLNAFMQARRVGALPATPAPKPAPPAKLKHLHVQRS